MRYRDIALQVMTTTLLGCRASDLAPAETAKAIDAAYPFGARARWPYKAWLAERRVFFAAHGLPRKGDYRRQRDRQGDLVSAMTSPAEGARHADGRQP